MVPGNDYPTDKATYDVTVTAPSRDTVISNGRRVSMTRHGSSTTTHWRMNQPMATYLSFLAIGRYQVVRTTSPGDVPTTIAYERGGGALVARARRAVAQTPAVLAFLRRHWGPYPFSAAGGIVTTSPGSGAFESQSRPNYESGLWHNQDNGLWAVVHENAHQWFGDSVTAANWEQFWLAEGFAMYSEWLWSQFQREGTAEQLFLAYYHLYPRHDVFWRTAVVPSSSQLPTQIYFRGAMTLQALRNRVGTRTFYAILHRWLASHRHQNGLTRGFIHLAEQVSGDNLSAFFHTWLYSRTRPAPTRQNGFPAGTRQQLRGRTLASPFVAHGHLSKRDDRYDTAMSRRTRVAAAIGVLACYPLLGLPVSTAAVPLSAHQPSQYLPGASSLGDPLAPGLGNGGYTVSHYRIDVTYRPATGRLTGSTTITAQATQDLSTFDLDFALTASSVTVDARRAASFRSKPGRIGNKLLVTPSKGIRRGTRFTVTVRYSGTPASIKISRFTGWQRTPTGVISWEQAPPSPAEEWWYPGNDYPSDQASYDITVTVPKSEHRHL